jgi:tungstate transport system ATP-binding protein
MNGQPLYQLEQVKRIVNGDDVILDVDSLDILQGGLTAIVGPNGAGKSTLLKILAFLETPEQGTVRYQGRQVRPGDHVGLRRQVTMVDQAPLLFRGTVFKNVSYGLKVRRVPSQEWPERVADALALVDLGGFEQRSVKGLSGGETQRVAIARALVFKPQVILLDEPTAGIDVARKEMVESLITGLHAAMGVTVLFSTHSLAQAFNLTERVVHLAGGKRVPGGIENIFSGQASEQGEVGLVRLKSGATLRTGSVPTGPVRLAIPASAVGIEPFSGPEDRANHFDSIITRMELRGTKVRILLSGRLNLRAEMSPEDLQRKDLKLGSRVTAIVPPDAIHLL